ncbi:hypothetical protein DMP08_09290 [Paraeggerthella hongkongensis]|uniref:Uncharacterized protein n=1 Tax=Paraeggerthella hongkongensis TaxID=230658 RepID=A0A3N0B2G3_9ACTN|nr:hypothetical protein DMP08_09290 [Paraeggerthella hongkongensis]
MYPFARRSAGAFAAWYGKGLHALLAAFWARIAIDAHSPAAALRRVKTNEFCGDFSLPNR